MSIISVTSEDGELPDASKEGETSEDEERPTTRVETGASESEGEEPREKPATPVEDASEKCNKQIINYYCDVCKKAIRFTTGNDFAYKSALEEHDKQHHKLHSNKPENDEPGSSSWGGLQRQPDCDKYAQSVPGTSKAPLRHPAGTPEHQDMMSSNGDRIVISTGNDFYSKDARKKPREVEFPTSGRYYFRRNVEYRGPPENQVPPHMWDYECAICGLEFYNRRNKDRHIREVHAGQGKVQCPDCEKVFTQKGNMWRHRKQEHLEHLTPVFKCDICNKIFTQVGSLRRHEVNIHTEPERLKCKHCPATYAAPDKLKKHLESGKHHIEYYCKCCRQKIIFKSLKAKEAHCQVIQLIPKAKWMKRLKGEPTTALSCKNNPHPVTSFKTHKGSWFAKYKRYRPKKI